MHELNRSYKDEFTGCEFQVLGDPSHIIFRTPTGETGNREGAETLNRALYTAMRGQGFKCTASGVADGMQPMIYTLASNISEQEKLHKLELALDSTKDKGLKLVITDPIVVIDDAPTTNVTPVNIMGSNADIARAVVNLIEEHFPALKHDLGMSGFQEALSGKLGRDFGRQ